jgi:hypothetical protein
MTERWKRVKTPQGRVQQIVVLSMRWFIDRDADGTVARVIRIHDGDDGLWGEFFRDGEWVTDPVVLGVLEDSTWGQPVSAEEGEQILAGLLGQR